MRHNNLSAFRSSYSWMCAVVSWTERRRSTLWALIVLDTAADATEYLIKTWRLCFVCTRTVTVTVTWWPSVSTLDSRHTLWLEANCPHTHTHTHTHTHCFSDVTIAALYFSAYLLILPLFVNGIFMCRSTALDYERNFWNRRIITFVRPF